MRLNLKKISKILFSGMTALILLSLTFSFAFADNISDEDTATAISHYNTAKAATPSDPNYKDYQQYLTGTDQIIAAGQSAAAQVIASCQASTDAAAKAQAQTSANEIIQAAQRQAAFTYTANQLKGASSYINSPGNFYTSMGAPVNNSSLNNYISTALAMSNEAACVSKGYQAAGCLSSADSTALRQAAKGDCTTALKNFQAAQTGTLYAPPTPTQLTPLVTTSSAGCEHGGTGFVSSGYYCLLTGLGNFFPGNEVNIRAGTSAYLSKLYQIGVAVATGLALIYITIGGVQYASTDSFTGSLEGRKTIGNALFGLGVVLSSYILLNAINPRLLENNLSLQPVGQFDSVSAGAPKGVTADNTTIFTSNGGSAGGDFGSGTVYNKISPDAYIPNGTPFSPNLTAYSPQANGDAMEGGYASSKPGLDGQSVVRTLDDVAAGRSGYVTIAGDPSQYGKTYIIPSITYTDGLGDTHTLTNVVGYVHDTGSAFTGAGVSHFDIAVGRDYGTSLTNSQGFTGGKTAIVGATTK